MAAGWWTCDEISGLVVKKRDKKCGSGGPTTASEEEGQEVEVKAWVFTLEISGNDMVYGVT